MRLKTTLNLLGSCVLLVGCASPYREDRAFETTAPVPQAQVITTGNEGLGTPSRKINGFKDGQRPNPAAIGNK